MIALTGASGHLGQLTLTHLLQKTPASQLVAIVRDPAKLGTHRHPGIAIRTADYDDTVALEEALDGVETLLQVSSSASGSVASRQELNVVQAAAAAGVRKIVYTSTLVPGADAVFLAGRTCGATEQAIKDHGLAYTFFRNSMYFETIPLFIGNALQDGMIYYPGGNGKVSFVSREDIAEALAIVLTESGQHENVDYRITGAEALSFAGLAGLLNARKGVDSSYFDIPEADFVEELGKAGVPQAEIEFTVSMAASIRAGEFEAVDDRLEKLLGRKRRAVSTYIGEL
ncbi:NAD(P)H-binding protein [Parapedobacter pyrenivorans]|uniref:NAD(P)H-binding protein n=1 Tax=Parapedobacter pyrenivorans TaxID=1305674 RepID=UPI0033420C98